MLVANDRDIVALGAAHHSKPKHPVKAQSALEISHSNPDVIDPLDCDVWAIVTSVPRWLVGRGARVATTPSQSVNDTNPIPAQLINMRT